MKPVCVEVNSWAAFHLVSFSTCIKQINILIQYVYTRIASILFWDSTFTARMTRTLVYELKKKNYWCMADIYGVSNVKS